jgi:hypothetical protein
MEMSHLRYVIAAAEVGGFRAAARALGEFVAHLPFRLSQK